ncbi:anti-sigma factor domain-containing protein [Halomicrobium salinisoli]|uniref:anti-sigma factor domain-containing protein n=1 Tax=Halomicrobium salinisoli TaxID=2878391 RepID=UPI001CF08FD6|nr:anti-sigma factor [Halomicrobium salinisoli]
MTDDVSDSGSGEPTRRTGGRSAGATRRSFVKTIGAGALASGLGGGAAGVAAAQSGEMHRLELDLRDLPELSTGHYEGWAIFGEEKVSTGTFSAGGMHSFEVDRDLSAADRIAITIEPDDDPSEAPSGVVVLAGELKDGVADLSFPVDFTDVSGSYILATPTDGQESHETSGVWFLDPSGDGPSASLDLPELPGGWTYEGWVVHEGQPISTGRFDDPAMADDSAAYAGDETSPPPFPGADLIQNAPEGLEFPTDLTDGSSKVVVSVEPDIDGTDPTGPAPFSIKPLAGSVPADGTDHVSYDLDRKTDTLPSGTAMAASEPAPGEKHRLEVDLTNLPDLSTGHYEGWAIFGEEKVSTGTFSTGGAHAFEVDRDLSEADAVVVTIEPDDDPSEAPSGVVVLAGPVHNNVAALRFPVDLWGAQGSYILATPTDGPDSHETSGVWFLEPGEDGPSASLDLPELPGGWTYEGWVVHEGQPISTGRFDDPAMGDDSAAYAGDENSPPPFPGADLIQDAPDGLSFPTDLTDGSSKVVVSVEPDVDGTDPTGPAPFSIKPLAGSIPADGTDHTGYDLAQQMGTVPLGTARIKGDGSPAVPTVGVELADAEVGTSGTATASIVLSEAPDGLSGFEVDVSLGDPSVASIAGASYPEGYGPTADPQIADDGSSVSLEAADGTEMVQPGDADVELATVELTAESGGETDVAVAVQGIQAENGSPMATATTGGVLSVTAVEPIEGALPTDPDGDGLYEDLNGNGEVDFDDVVRYFKHMDEPVVTDHVAAYDYNGNGGIDYDDVVELFAET